MLAFSPGYFHNVVATSGANPVFCEALSTVAALCWLKELTFFHLQIFLWRVTWLKFVIPFFSVTKRSKSRLLKALSQSNDSSIGELLCLPFLSPPLTLSSTVLGAQFESTQGPCFRAPQKDPKARNLFIQIGSDNL